MSKILETALDAHRNNNLNLAASLYREHLINAPKDMMALYGLGSILLFEGSLGGLDLIQEALSQPDHPDFNKALAAESVFSTLLSHQYREHALAFLHEMAEKSILVNDLKSKIKSLEIPPYLAATYVDQQLGQSLRRYSPIESSQYVYAIDIVGGCNLRCPTCPVANQPSMPKGLMDISLFRNILKKIQIEEGQFPPDIWLFNWTEPLLHPQIDVFVRAVREFNFTSFISSNLNAGERLEALMKSEPDRLKISLSSFKQEIYGVTHERGDISKVKKNLIELARLRDQYKAKTKIWIGHHLYTDTLEECSEVEAFAINLGFTYSPSPATVTPIEEVMRLFESEKLSVKDDLSAHYRNLSGKFLFDPLNARKQNSLKRSGNYDCELRFNMTAIQYDGRVNLCCATVQPLSIEPVSFLTSSKMEIENMKYNNPFCKRCISSNFHLTISDR